MAGDTVQEIKERLSIADVVAPYVKLKRAGKSTIGLCPFHKEKTGSFHVSPERGTFHCFGCGVGGDMFSFIEKIEGVDFKGALKMLAEKAGVELRYEAGSGERKAQEDRLREMMARAARFYAEHLPKDSAPYVYAAQRGLSHETITSWGLGYAPEGWRVLLEALSAQGCTTAELLAVGLIKEADGKPGTYYDRFRNRLMFPIRDTQGRVVAFTGRALDPEDPAKYLNSPETPLYHKSDLLFGFDRAKDSIRTRGYAMLVEGQMDLLLAHQAGFANAIALSGTALTERHLSLVKRYSENLMLVLDADPAGLTATARSAQLALSLGIKVKAARLPKGKDPADLLLEDPKDFTKRIAEARPVVEFFLAELSDREKDQHKLIALAERIVLPLIAALKSPMEREHFAHLAGRALGLSSEAVRESLGHMPKAAAPAASRPEEKPAARRSPKEVRAEQVLAVIAAYPGTELAKRVEGEYYRITEAQELPKEILPESVIFHVETLFGERPEAGAADELLNAFEQAVIREAYQGAVGALRRAEQAGDTEGIKKAGAECAELSTRLARLGR